MAGLHTLTRTTKRPSAAVGRGGKRGKTSGRGMKGQRARAGNRPRPELRDMIKKYPKLRGHGKNRARGVNSARQRPVAVSLSAIGAAFAAGEAVTPATLVEKGVVGARGGKIPAAKIVANGEIKTALNVEGVAISAAAKEAVEKAGGTVK